MNLHELNMNNGPLTDKGSAHNYLVTYEKEMDKLDNVTLLEIGVWMAGSLKLWSMWLNNPTIYGIDNYPMFGGIVPEEVLSPLYTILSVDSQAKAECPFEDEMFDYIIDDAMHDATSIIKTFNIYWPKLKSGGKYFIEDVLDDSQLSQICQRVEGYSYTVFDTRATHTPNDVLIVIQKP